MSSTSNKTSTGLDQNLAGLLCYVGAWITGIIFLILEKDNRFVRFHAIQSIFAFGAITIVDFIFQFIPYIGWVIIWLLGVLAFIIWIVMMLKAYRGEMYKLPIVGDLAEKYNK